MSSPSAEPTIISALVWNCGNKPGCKGKDLKHAIHNDLQKLMKYSREEEDKPNAIYAPFRRYVIKHIFSAELKNLPNPPELLLLQEIGAVLNLPFIGKRLMLPTAASNNSWKSVVTRPASKTAEKKVKQESQDDQMKQLNQFKGTGTLWNGNYDIIGAYHELFSKNTDDRILKLSSNILNGIEKSFDEELQRRFACFVLNIHGVSILFCSFHAINRNLIQDKEEAEKCEMKEVVEDKKQYGTEDDEDDEEEEAEEEKIKMKRGGNKKIEEKKRLLIRFLNQIITLADEKTNGNIVIGMDTNLGTTNIEEFLEETKKSNEWNYTYEIYQVGLTVIFSLSKSDEFYLVRESRGIIDRDFAMRNAIENLRQEHMPDKDLSQAIEKSNFNYIFDHIPLCIQFKIYPNTDEAKKERSKVKEKIDRCIEELNEYFRKNLNLKECLPPRYKSFLQATEDFEEENERRGLKKGT